jgi:uncharacterized protein YndB with AHSA1/START domain
VTGRTDTASRLIEAPAADIYRALTDAEAVAAWLPPANMTGEILAFEPRENGAFDMVLTYRDPEPGVRGKSGDDIDIVRGRFVSLSPDAEIVQEFVFESDDPAFAGTMRMTWTLAAISGGTEVTIRCDDVPAGITEQDHAVALRSSLDNLANYVLDPRA